jgi:tRNA nucleotidyltransferase (CCA-adding enzyme)
MSSYLPNQPKALTLAPARTFRVGFHTEMGPQLELTSTEERLKRLLLVVASQENTSRSPEGTPTELENQTTTLRFTGGWVRDKLLGISSHDIDVAISNMTGYQYLTKLKNILDDPGMAEQLRLNSSESDGSPVKDGKAKKAVMGSIHKIEKNPEKSKHLETGSTHIMGLELDFVNLRKETYTTTSRVPQMEFGTPKEDALRRDATINALFYNLHTSLVEDFTGQGLDDMKAQIIRTPLEPFQTFEDDPLRVLRLIRFASRLNFKIDPATEAAMADTSIQEALRHKISRERIGTELEKMLTGISAS